MNGEGTAPAAVGAFILLRKMLHIIPVKKMTQLTLFDTSCYITQTGLDSCFCRLKHQLKDYLAEGDKERFTIAFNQIANLNELATGQGLQGIQVEEWGLQRERWGIKANALIGRIYKKMSSLDISELGWQEVNRIRVHLQKKLNKIGKIAGRRGQLREDDGYLWFESGSGLKPYLPL